MKYPTLTEIEKSRSIVEEFRGYNHNLRINNTEFYDMKNLTSSHYPVLSPREARRYHKEAKSPQGLIEKDVLCYVDGGNFVINDYPINLGLSMAEEDCPKQLVSMGAYVIILPDRKWIDTSKWDAEKNTFNATDEAGNIVGYGDIDVTNKTVSATTFSLTRLNDEEYTDYTSSPSEPEDGANGDLWLDQSSSPHTLKQYSESSGMWVAIATTYIKITSPGIGVGLKQYDGITISGLNKDENGAQIALKSDVIDDTTGENAPIQGTSAEQIAALDGNMVVWECDDDSITVIGILDTKQTVVNEIAIERKMPKLDFVTESENRLWGCRYGIANNGQVVNEIYACKLGDFKNWNCFMGLSTDSYAASCGTDGRFTGAVTHLGYPIFFKENCLHKVYGNYPANYQIQTTNCRGVDKGSHNSLAIVNEVLYYKSKNGVCAYDGSLPTEISYALGNEHYVNAVACAYRNKYYISMEGTDGKYHLFVYDTANQMWHKEDNLRVKFFCSARDVLYYVEYGDETICTIDSRSGIYTWVLEDKVEWMAETGIIGDTDPDRKYISRLNIKMSLAIGSRVHFYIQYNSTGEWEHISTMTGTSLKTFSLPIRPKRCDHLRLRIEGEGEAKIYSLTKTIEYGSDK